MYHTAETKGQSGAPLVVTFHGTGGDENQFHGLAHQILPDAHVISPRGDVSEQGMNRYFRRTGEGVYDMADLAQRSEAMASFVFDTKIRLAANRVIGLGYSNGANILAAVAFRYPELLSDLALMHPLIPWSPEPQPGLEIVQVQITAGRQDPICPAPMTQALADWFTAQGSATKLHWHPGGHEIAREELQAVADFMQGQPLVQGA